MKSPYQKEATSGKVFRLEKRLSVLLVIALFISSCATDQGVRKRNKNIEKWQVQNKIIDTMTDTTTLYESILHAVKF